MTPVNHNKVEKSRIAKVIARAGICSRREAERMIVAGHVCVNGKPQLSPAFNVNAADLITVHGEPLPQPTQIRLWRFHKPAGLVTTHKDPENRPTVFDALPKSLPRVIAVGRLDLATEGLLLLTNDGGLARHLELPSTGWLRRYRVRVHGRVSQGELNKLKNGTTIDGVNYGPADARLDRKHGTNCWITISLREGKNREVKKLLASFGLQVNRLIRLSYGPFPLGDLKPGAITEVKSQVLADQLGTKICRQLNIPQQAATKRKNAK